MAWTGFSWDKSVGAFAHSAQSWRDRTFAGYDAFMAPDPDAHGFLASPAFELIGVGGGATKVVAAGASKVGLLSGLRRLVPAAKTVATTSYKTPVKFAAASGVVGVGGWAALSGLGKGFENFGSDAGHGFQDASERAGQGLGDGLAAVGDGLAKGALGLGLAAVVIVGGIVAVKIASGSQPKRSRR